MVDQSEVTRAEWITYVGDSYGECLMGGWTESRIRRDMDLHHFFSAEEENQVVARAWRYHDIQKGVYEGD